MGVIVNTNALNTRKCHQSDAIRKKEKTFFIKTNSIIILQHSGTVTRYEKFFSYV